MANSVDLEGAVWSWSAYAILSETFGVWNFRMFTILHLG